MMTSRAAMNGAPNKKNIKARESKAMTIYSRAWTAFKRVMTIMVENSATAAAR
jgi:hypothetical protein